MFPSRRGATLQRADAQQLSLCRIGDHLGSPAITANGATGAKLSELRYAWNTTVSDFRYTGQRQTGTGLMDYGARMYDPSIAHFSQPDIIIPDTYNSLDWNRYAYARSNPIRYNDPSGHCTGDSSDKNNPDMACWDKWRRISEKYEKIIVSVMFTLAELDFLLQALDYAACAFGGVDKFQANTGVFWITRGGDYGGPSGIFKRVTLYGSDFKRPKNDSLFTILHEIGHILIFMALG